jgi:radial spoke head protein 9
LELSLQ